MSIKAGININFLESVNLAKLTQIMLKDHWTLDDHGRIYYLKPNDNFNFDWLAFDFDESAVNKVIKVLESKHNNMDFPNGVVILNNDEYLSGGHFIVNNDGKGLTINLSVNIKYINKKIRLVDFSFYLNKLMPILERLNSKVYSVNCTVE